MKYILREETKATAVANTKIVSPTVVWCEGNDQVVIGLPDTPDDTALSMKQETETATAKDLYLELQTPPVTMETWTFHNTIDCSNNKEFNVIFKVGDVEHKKIELGPEMSILGDPGMKYTTNESAPYDYEVYNNGSWSDLSAKTITLLDTASAEAILLKNYLADNADLVTN